MYKNVTELKFEASNSKKYKIETIWNSADYVKKVETALLSGYTIWFIRKVFQKKIIFRKLI